MFHHTVPVLLHHISKAGSGAHVWYNFINNTVVFVPFLSFVVFPIRTGTSSTVFFVLFAQFIVARVS